MQDKRQETYERVLNHENFLTGGVNPNSINFDFKRAAINATETIYPNTNLYACLFHLSQNIYRNVQVNGRSIQYQNDPVFRTNIRMICGSAFVPTRDIETSFTILSQHCGWAEAPILDYLETYYIAELRRGVRCPPMLEHSLWSVYHRVINKLPRTTNALEGWHNAFARSVGQSHANIWKFIDTMKMEHVHIHIAITKHNNYGPILKAKVKYTNVNDRINNIVADYANKQRMRTISNDILEFTVFCTYIFVLIFLYF